MNAIVRHETPKSETKEFLTNSIESRISCLYQFFSFFLIFLYLFGLLGLSGGTRDLHCRVWDWLPDQASNPGPCVGSVESQLLDPQESPCIPNFGFYI